MVGLNSRRLLLAGMLWEFCGLCSFQSLVCFFIYIWISFNYLRNFAFKLLDFLVLNDCSFAVLLEGSPGVGKTSLIIALGKCSGHRVVRINFSEQVSNMFLVDLFLVAVVIYCNILFYSVSVTAKYFKHIFCADWYDGSVRVWFTCWKWWGNEVFLVWWDTIAGWFVLLCNISC